MRLQVWDKAYFPARRHLLMIAERHICLSFGNAEHLKIYQRWPRPHAHAHALCCKRALSAALTPRNCCPRARRRSFSRPESKYRTGVECVPALAKRHRVAYVSPLNSFNERFSATASNISLTAANAVKLVRPTERPSGTLRARWNLTERVPEVGFGCGREEENSQRKGQKNSK